jgi:hypothetical protein
VGAWRIRRHQTETGVHTNLPRFGPPKGKDIHPAYLILYCLYIWCCYNGVQMRSSYGRKEMACASLCVGSMRDLVSMGDCPPRGRPWWLYICSQLGFTSSLCLLFQVEVLGLAGFMLPSSGLLSWQEPGRPISRTRGVIPSSEGVLISSHCCYLPVMRRPC